jgi:hypothetical protein
MNYAYINKHLISVIRDVADDAPEKALPILQDALAKLRVAVDGFEPDDAAHWVDVTTTSIGLFAGATTETRDEDDN